MEGAGGGSVVKFFRWTFFLEEPPTMHFHYAISGKPSSLYKKMIMHQPASDIILSALISVT